MKPVFSPRKEAVFWGRELLSEEQASGLSAVSEKLRRFFRAHEPCVDGLKSFFEKEGWEIVKTRNNNRLRRIYGRNGKGIIVKIARISKFPKEFPEHEKVYLCPTIFPVGDKRESEGYMAVLMVQPELSRSTPEQQAYIKREVSEGSDRERHNVGTLNEVPLLYDW